MAAIAVADARIAAVGVQTPVADAPIAVDAQVVVHDSNAVPAAAQDMTAAIKADIPALRAVHS